MQPVAPLPRCAEVPSRTTRGPTRRKKAARAVDGREAPSGRLVSWPQRRAEPCGKRDPCLPRPSGRTSMGAVWGLVSGPRTSCRPSRAVRPQSKQVGEPVAVERCGRVAAAKTRAEVIKKLERVGEPGPVKGSPRFPRRRGGGRRDAAPAADEVVVGARPSRRSATLPVRDGKRARGSATSCGLAGPRALDFRPRARSPVGGGRGERGRRCCCPRAVRGGGKTT